MLPALVAQREFLGARGARALGAQAALPAHLSLDAELDAHGGCVNHLSWSSDGATLLSSGDDTRLIVWDTARRAKRGDLLTGHTANVFCVRPLPGTADAVVATCAGDSQVRVHDLQSGASPRVFDSHVRRVKKLQCEDGNPHLLFSASADSTVRMFDLRCPATPSPPRAGSLRQAAAEALQAPNVLVAVHHGRVELHSISIPLLRPHLFAVGGSDAVTRVYDRRFLAPRGASAPLAALLPEGVAADPAGGGVTGVAFSADGAALLASHLHGPVHLFSLAQPLGLGPSRHAPDAEAVGTPGAVAATQLAQREAPGVAAALEAAAAAAEAATHGDLDAAREAVEVALEHIASADNAAWTSARVARVAASRLRLARAEAILAAAARAGLAAGGFEARRLAQAALADAVSAASMAPREGRAPLTAARALRVLGHVIDAREQLAIAEALGWSAQLQRLRRELDRDAAEARDGGAADGSDDDGSSGDDSEADEADPDADAAAAMLELLREARAALRAVPPPPAPPPAAVASSAATAATVATRRFEGHRHAATIKDVAFIGDDEQCVASGSDDGRMFVWRTRDAALQCAPVADRSVVNCVQSAPGGGLRLASCGIDTTVKLWAPVGDGEHAAAAAAEAAEAAAANRVRRGADGGRRTMPRAVTLALLHLLRQTQFSPEDVDEE